MTPSDEKRKWLEDMLKMLSGTVTKSEFVASFKVAMDIISKALVDLTKKIDTRLSQIKDGTDGKDGKQGVQGIKGDKGERGATFIALRGAQGKSGASGKDGSPDNPIEIRDKLETLKDDERLDKASIKGIEKLEEDIKKIELRPIGRGGGAKGFMLYVDGAKKLLTAQTINLVAGTGMTLSYAYANGRNDITFTATGSASLTPIAVTGTVDDSNTSFTAASAPNLVIINGAAYRDGHGVTIVGTAITTASPIGVGGDIYAL